MDVGRNAIRFEVGQRWRVGFGAEIRITGIHGNRIYPVVGSNGESYTREGTYRVDGEHEDSNLVALVALPDGTERDHRDIQADPFGHTIIYLAAAARPDDHEALTFHPLQAAKTALDAAKLQKAEAEFAQRVPSAQPTTATEQVKLSNPKDAIGDTKVPLWLLSPIAKAHWALAQFAGMLKYGAWNWRAAGVRASVYLSAMERHIDAFKSGEEFDPVDGTKHLGNIMACAAILLDAEAAGKLIDDRPPAVGLRPAYEEVQAAMARLRELYKDKAPHHWSINDEVPA